MEVKVKGQFGDRFVAFGGMGKTPLKDWPQDKLVKLAETAKSSGDKSLLQMFEELPSHKALKEEKAKEIKPPVTNKPDKESDKQ